MLARFALPLILFIITCAGCTTTVTSEPAQSERSVDLRQYKTYSWNIPPMASIGIPAQRAQLAQSFVKTAVEKELTRSGYQPATYSAPDLYIATVLGVMDPAKLRPWKSADDSAAPAATSSGDGSVAIEVLDAKTGQLLWRSMVHHVVGIDESMKDTIEKGVQSMMATFPHK